MRCGLFAHANSLQPRAPPDVRHNCVRRDALRLHLRDCQRAAVLTGCTSKWVGVGSSGEILAKCLFACLDVHKVQISGLQIWHRVLTRGSCSILLVACGSCLRNVAQTFSLAAQSETSDALRECCAAAGGQVPTYQTCAVDGRVCVLVPFVEHLSAHGARHTRRKRGSFDAHSVVLACIAGASLGDAYVMRLAKQQHLDIVRRGAARELVELERPRCRRWAD